MSVSSEDDEEKYMAHLDDQEFNYPTEAAFSVELTTKRAVEYLIAGSLRDNVCRCCLAVTGPLSQLDEVLQIEGGPRQYNLSIKDLIASIYPYQITNDLYLPDKICEECIDKAVSSYRFIQQCERSERAIKNCFDHVHQSVSTIDPIERPKSRGRPKIHLNLNTLHAPFETVLEYAEPMINLVNRGAVPNEGSDGVINELECPKCWQEFSDLETLLRHGKEHAKTMWYHCKICGTAFAKHKNYLKHINSMHNSGTVLPLPLKYTQQYKCNECGALSDTYATHLQHCELHKFKEVLACVLYRQTERLCSVCFKTEREMIDLNEKMELFGGYPGLTGEHTPSSMLKHLLPTDSTTYSHVSNYLCAGCLDTITSSYILLQSYSEISKWLSSSLLELFDQVTHVGSQGISDLNALTSVFLVIDVPEIETDVKDMVSIEASTNSSENEGNETTYAENGCNNMVTEMKYSGQNNDGLKNFLHTERKFSCDYCNVRFRWERNLRRHEKKQHQVHKRRMANGIDRHDSSTTFYECTMCALDFDSKVELKVHEFTHPNGTTHICRKCSKIFTTKISLKDHMKVHRPIEQSVCGDCGKVFPNDYKLKKHKLMHERAKYICQYCNLSFKWKSNLRRHELKQHQTFDPKMTVICDLCGKQFASKSHLNVHIKGHESKQCPFCHKTLKGHPSYKIHIKRHLYGKTPKRNEYNKNHHCKLCPKSFVGNVALSEHMNSAHLDHRPYVCETCGKGFYRKGALKGHLIVHTQDRPEQCDICGSRFVCKKTLIQHLRLHTGEKPYICPKCPLGFVSATRRQEHVQRIHLNMSFHCNYCDTKFTTSGSRSSHIRRFHTNEIRKKSKLS